MSKSNSKWTTYQARQQLSELVRATAQEPQEVYNRDQLAAVVINPDSYEEFCQWRKEKYGASIADAFDELRRLCVDEDYQLEVGNRVNRKNTMVELLDELPGGY